MLAPQEIVTNLRALAAGWEHGEFPNDEELQTSIEFWKPTLLEAADTIEQRVMGILPRLTPAP